ncbi:aspartic proteinase nepenthesin-1-like [Macadamia integrifolia]|uniref:aspartic proteinase nepenthesin-1-like n=1 Tax=Macadamia integrifolia TaxID=60698 RepID=UPI001C52DD5A|nr:aspartic proteinase nepenthesin-1-like [Macadamia integrifolia]
MAFMETLLSLIFLLSSSLLLHSVAVHESPESITLSLIHPFSIHSPFYPGKNVTDVEKINLLIKATEAHMQHLFPTTTMRRQGSQNGSSEIDDIGALVGFNGAYYLAIVGIGSFPPVPGPKFKTYSLVMDTGSVMTWVQCEGCDPCLPLLQPNFPYRRSQSYSSIPCGHKDCPTPERDCHGQSCGFKVRYGDINRGPITRGTIVRETLAFTSDISRGAIVSYSNSFLGCGLHSSNYGFPTQSTVAGILGLGPGGYGTKPIWKQVAKKRFSYCLFISEHASSKLYIGGERMVGPQVVSTPLVGGSNPTLYYVDLHDISIAGIRLGLQRSALSGGCAIDTGAPMTSLVANIYALVRASFVRYFAQYGIQPYGSRGRPSNLPDLDLCFPKPPSFNRFPTMTFHFREADLVVQPTGIFSMGTNYICVTIKPATETLIGAHQQTQHRFFIDFELGNRVFFAPENCGATT